MRMKCCIYCKKRFKPDKRLGIRQVTCGAEKCKKQHNKHCQQEWHRKNPDYNKDRYLATKDCPSRASEKRKQRRKKTEFKAKQAKYMKMYRQKRKLESGQPVRCTKFEIAINSLIPEVMEQSSIRVSVGCTKLDSAEKSLLTGGFKDLNENLWNVRCTKLVR